MLDSHILRDGYLGTSVAAIRESVDAGVCAKLLPVPASATAEVGREVLIGLKLHRVVLVGMQTDFVYPSCLSNVLGSHHRLRLPVHRLLELGQESYHERFALLARSQLQRAAQLHSPTHQLGVPRRHPE